MDNKLYDKIESTGEWWLDPWWEDRNWLGAERYPIELLSEAVGVLKEFFPAEWAKQLFDNPQQNIIMPILIGHNAMALGALFHLGFMCKRARSTQGFSSIVKRLRESDSDSAFFELEMGDIFLEKEIQVDFPRPGAQKTPDIIAHCSDIKIEIECKRLRTEAWNYWENNLTTMIMSVVSEIADRDGIELQIELNDRITDICFDDEKYPGFNEAISRGIVDKIKNTVVKKLEGQKLPVEFTVSGLMVGQALCKGDPGGTYVRGAAISNIAKLRRIITNGMFRGLPQLSGKVPGVLCIYSDYLPEPELVRVILDSLTIDSSKSVQSQFSPMSALLLFPRQTIFERNPPLLFENKNALFSFPQLEAAEHIKKSFAPLVA